MTPSEQHTELRDRILQGLEIAYEKLIQFKKQKNSVIVIIKDGKVTKVKP